MTRTAAMAAMVEGKPVVRCAHCLLNQFETEAKLCRRCKQPFPLPEPEPTPKPVPVRVLPVGMVEIEAQLARAVALQLQTEREGRGLTQEALGRRMGVNRTYVSKVENGAALPSVSSLDRFAVALGLSLAELMLRIDTLRRMFDAARGQA